jgi:uncharacterized membrane protein YgcG
MQRSKYPPGNNRHNVETSTSFAAAVVAIALNFINILLGGARDVAQAIVPDSAPKLVLAGGARHTRGWPMETHRNNDKSMLMVDSRLAGRSHRHGTASARSSGQFGGGGRDFRNM